MPKIELVANTEEESTSALFDNIDFSKKRNPTEDEIKILEQNKNFSSDSSWKNLFVDENFDVNMIKSSEFIGKIVLGKISNSCLKYHDLMLPVGIFNSTLHDCVIGDDVCIKNVAYLKNHFVESHVILFNIQEMSCTLHSKFGNGILKSGEPEENRIWIGVGNENDGRAVLPFEDMIPADAFLWSRFRGDKELMNRFIELTEDGNSGELNTFGFVGEDSVVKNCTLIKDVKIGKNAYIKGAFKLKNITVCSSYDEPSQIGEGVEMVNGILGYGSRVFYQAVAVRFVIGRNCQLKYGARLLNTILGDNSTVSCCELLNNLIFPFHEQHHNSSFLIATTLLGQSNIAAGATIGSNHNSRSPDGEIYAGRGFWSGLCSDFKHNSKFASFTLVAKGSYQYELNILYPFSLVSSNSETGGINVLPGYWFLYNMFAIARNNSKFKSRDRRIVKAQHIETDPFAPDTIQEVLFGLDRIIELTGRWLTANNKYVKDSTISLLQQSKDFLHQNSNAEIVLEDPQCMKKNGAKILKAPRGYKEYRKVAKYFAVKTFIEFCNISGRSFVSKQDFEDAQKNSLYTKWMNVGGQIIPEDKVNELFDLIKTKKINSWDEVHQFYDECQKNYSLWKIRYAIYVLEKLYSKNITEFTAEIIKDIINDVLNVSNYIYESSLSSREKDYIDYFRTITYSSKEEMTAVIGTIQDVKFLKELEVSTKEFNESLETLFSKFI